MQGIITKVVRKKREPETSYGFITADCGDQFYFRLRWIDWEIQEGERVEFLPRRNIKGRFAQNIRKGV